MPPALAPGASERAVNFGDPKKLYFFFDYISHNAYLAWTRMPALAQKHGLALEPVPVLFAGMLSHYKQIGPAEIPAKSRWMLWNVLRKAKEHGIPIAPPASHPFNPLLPLRVSCCDFPADQKITLVDRLYRAVWAESRAIAEAETVHSLLAELGLDAQKILGDAQSEPVKQRLRQNTEDALAAGVFGVPGMRVRGELFWGFDDLEYLEMFLQGRDPLPADRGEYRAWLDVKPSAERKR
jgi:2-hydroxychromene-2-carboxylate isomerase